MLLQSPLRNGDHPEEKIMDPVMMTVMHDGDTFFYYDSYLIMMSMMIIDLLTDDEWPLPESRFSWFLLCLIAVHLVDIINILTNIILTNIILTTIITIIILITTIITTTLHVQSFSNLDPPVSCFGLNHLLLWRLAENKYSLPIFFSIVSCCIVVIELLVFPDNLLIFIHLRRLA